MVTILDHTALDFNENHRRGILNCESSDDRYMFSNSKIDDRTMYF